MDVEMDNADDVDSSYVTAENDNDKIMQHAYNIDLVMLNIIKHVKLLPERDLRSLRKTSRVWMDVLDPHLRTIQKKILVFQGEDEENPLLGLCRRSHYYSFEEFQKFMETMSTSFSLSYGKFAFNNIDLEQGLGRFIQSFGPCITYLCLHLEGERRITVEGFKSIIFEQTPSLKELCFTNWDFKDSNVAPNEKIEFEREASSSSSNFKLPSLTSLTLGTDLTFFPATDLITKVCNAATNLEVFEISRDATAYENDLSTIYATLQTLENIAKFRELTIPLSAAGLNVLIELSEREENRLVLKKFSASVVDDAFVENIGEIVTRFLNLQKNSLLELNCELDTHDDDQELITVSIPQMTSLLDLRIELARQVHFIFESSQGTTFPSLRSLSYNDIMEDGERFGVLEKYNAYSEQMATSSVANNNHLAELHLMFRIKSCDLLVKSAKAFLNLSKLSVHLVDKSLMSCVWKLWEGLKELVILLDFEVDDRKTIDEAITGIACAQHKYLVPNPANGLAIPDSIDEKLKTFKHAPGISDLKGLRSFQLKTDFTYWLRKDEVQPLAEHKLSHMRMSDISVYFGFLQLEQLVSLKISGFGFEEISQSGWPRLANSIVQRGGNARLKLGKGVYLPTPRWLFEDLRDS